MSNKANNHLPDGWLWVQLNEICAQDREIVEPHSPESANLQYLSLEHIEQQSGRILRAPKDAIEDEGKSTTFRFDSRHVLYGKLRPYLNKVALPDAPGRCTTEAIPLLPKSNVTRDFLAWLLRRQETVDYAMQGKTGSRMPRASMDELLKMSLPLPPLAEQKRIAGILKEQLAAVERARAAAEQQLAAARKLPAAYLREILEGESAQKWPRTTLGEVCRDISDGTHFTPIYLPTGVPFLSVKDVKESGIIYDNCRYISQEQHEDLCRRCKPEPGDVLYTKVGTTGVAKAIEDTREFSIFVSVALLKLLPLVSARYLEFVLNSPFCRAQAEELTQGAANRNLVLRDLKSIVIPLPNRETQRQVEDKIVNLLKDTMKLQDTLQFHLTATNNLPPALLRAAFQGRL